MQNIISETELENMRIENQRANDGNRYATDLRRNAQANNQSVVSNNVRMDLYNDLFTDGVIIQYPHGRVMVHGQKPFYYRGQIRDFGSCKPSLYRNICNDDEDTKRIKIFVNEMKLFEFNDLILQFKQVSQWPFGDVFTYAIAQHYGFETNIIDITNDLEVALFFACCKHIGNNKYQPLCEEEIKSEEDRYGVLFIRDQFYDSFDISAAKDVFMTVYPIGFQPFTRCHKQKGFFVHTELDDDLQTSGKFIMHRFQHSIKLSQEIFNKFHGGKDLFAYDALDEISDLITAIQSAKSFSEKSFCAAYNSTNDGIPEVEWVEMLRKKLGVKIGNSSFKLSRQRRRIIDRKWSVERFVEEEKIAPGFRMIYRP